MPLQIEVHGPGTICERDIEARSFGTVLEDRHLGRCAGEGRRSPAGTAYGASVRSERVLRIKWLRAVSGIAAEKHRSSETTR